LGGVKITGVGAGVWAVGAVGGEGAGDEVQTCVASGVVSCCWLASSPKDVD